MQDYKLGDTLITKGVKFSLNQCPKNDFEEKKLQKVSYASTVGSLIFAQFCTQPDITYVTGMLSKYLSNPRVNPWKSAKWVLRCV